MIIDVIKYHESVKVERAIAKKRNLTLEQSIIKSDPLAKMVSSAFIAEIRSVCLEEFMISREGYFSILKYIELYETEDVQMIKPLNNAQYVALIYIKYIKQIIKLNTNLTLEKNDILILLSCVMHSNIELDQEFIFKSYDSLIKILEEFGTNQPGFNLALSLLWLINFSALTERVQNLEQVDFLVEACKRILPKAKPYPTTNIDYHYRSLDKNWKVIKVDLYYKLKHILTAIKSLATKNEKWFIFSILYMFVTLYTTYKFYYYYDYYNGFCYDCSGNRVFSFFFLSFSLIAGYIGAAFISSRKSFKLLMLENIKYNADLIKKSENKSDYEATYLAICTCLDDMAGRSNGKAGIKFIIKDLLVNELKEYHDEVLFYLNWKLGTNILQPEVEDEMRQRHYVK